MPPNLLKFHENEDVCKRVSSEVGQYIIGSNSKLRKTINVVKMFEE